MSLSEFFGQSCNPRSLNNKKLATISVFILFLCVNSVVSNKSNSIDRRKNAGQEDTTSSPYQTGGCAGCKKHKDLKQMNLEFIQADILKKLGFESPPNVTGRVLPQIPPSALASLSQDISMQSDEPIYKAGPTISEEYDDYHVKTEKVITFAQPYPRLRHGWRDKDILHFGFSDSLTKYLVGSAYLYVNVNPVERRNAGNEVVYIEVFKVYKAPDHPEVPGMKKVAWTKVPQPEGKADWIKVDITEMVSEWFKAPRENLGLIVTGTVNGKKAIVTDTQSHSKVPYVEVTTKEGRRRTRRSNGFNCDEKNIEPICCRYPLIVDFEAIGYDFIIAPKTYEAFYCAGECPIITLQKHPHTHLMTMASNDKIPRCCTPRKLSPIRILYFDRDLNVMYGSLPGMVVDRCGC